MLSIQVILIPFLGCDGLTHNEVTAVFYFFERKILSEIFIIKIGRYEVSEIPSIGIRFSEG
jgi:hypothetical protein